MSAHVEAEDLEQQPLQTGNSTNYGASLSQPQENDIKHPSLRVRRNLIAITVICLILGAVGLYVSRFIPSTDIIQAYYDDATKIKIHSISYEGWDSEPQEVHSIKKGVFALKEGDSYKYLKLRAKVGVQFDHDQALAISNSSTDARRKKAFLKFSSQSLVRTLCFDLNNMKAYNDNATASLGLGSVRIPQTVCVDLRANKTTELDLPIVVYPDTENIASVIIKIWKRKFHELNLWSSFDVTLSKWGLPIGRVLIPRLDWNELFDWRQVQSYVDEMQDILKEPIKVDDLEITDSDEAVNFHIATSYTCPERFKDILTAQKNSVIPPMSWKVRMPGCDGSEPIFLQNADFQTPSIPVKVLFSPGPTAINITGQIYGPLPDELLYQVCDSDEENVVTPINLFLKNVFNSTESVKFDISGHHADRTNNSIVPKCFLDEILPSILQEIHANLTLNSDQLVEQVSIDGMKLKWVQRGWDEKNLEVKGKVNILVNLPYYSAAHSKGQETVSIKKIKGLTKVFHNDVHFVSVPMDVWLNAESEIVKSEEQIQLRVSFDIAGQNVVVEDKIELTKCLNEILVKGQAQVYVEGKLDLMMDTKLGSIVLLGLKGDGNTVIRT
ncbi:LAME_0E09538g1_1 [Lachancea meyersii CBS 8951]|uniref:LAME_0E09538g1_1 n=1 Tax=Lachancea meyersii CBS 8951 TaxID=1266667 RepID=A0A1G4JJJ9_9SACH|nr:LAME_0E09538g1_1 [Lachancea meyersii CBS 8951]